MGGRSTSANGALVTTLLILTVLAPFALGVPVDVHPHDDAVGVVAVSGTGDAHGGVAVSGAGDAGGVVALAPAGNATSGVLAATALGNATCGLFTPCTAVSASGDSRGWVAVSVLGDATSPYAFCASDACVPGAAVSGAGHGDSAGPGALLP